MSTSVELDKAVREIARLRAENQRLREHIAQMERKQR